MSKDKFEDGVRSSVGPGARSSGATDHKASEVKRAYGEVADSAKDAAKEITESGSIPDLSQLRDDIAKLTQTVSDLARQQVGAAGDSLSQSAAVAQDKFAAVESAVESRIKKNPWGAVAVASLIGLLIGKMS
jgi:ElaB/YqjD/DUF883 family membrane-anchored ribosome-binding protein